MNVRGSCTIEAPSALVFAALCDPGVLLDIIPGCREIARIGDGEYSGRITIRVPGLVGSYRTSVRLVDTDGPAGGKLEGEVVGAAGSLRGDAWFRLTEAEGRTTVAYEGRAVVDGPLARLDTRFVEGLVTSLIGRGLGTLGSRLRLVAPAGAGRGTGQPHQETSA